MSSRSPSRPSTRLSARERLGKSAGRTLPPGEEIVAGAYARLPWTQVPSAALLLGGLTIASGVAAGEVWIVVPGIVFVIAGALGGLVLRKRRLSLSHRLGAELRLGMSLALTTRGRLVIFRALPGGQFSTAVATQSLLGMDYHRNGASALDPSATLAIHLADGGTLELKVGRHEDAAEMVQTFEHDRRHED